MPAIEVVHARVFALEAGGGNPCPVVLAADGLGEGEMRALARRFGLDTVFVLRPRAPGADLRLRYFLPEREMGFSGHATIAALRAWRMVTGDPRAELRFETANGVFGAMLTARDGDAARGDDVDVSLATGVPAFGRVLAPEDVAAALGVAPAAVDVSAGPVQIVGAPRAKVLVPLVDHAALDAVAPDFALLWGLCERWSATGFYPFTLRPERPSSSAEARQFPYRAGFPEDPATGVAAAALAAYLARHERARADGTRADGPREYTFLQGRAMGAPSRIAARAVLRGGEVVDTAVAGSAVITGRERVAL
jgi:PhzF family phenazine biosynthesis protein